MIAVLKRKNDDAKIKLMMTQKQIKRIMYRGSIINYETKNCNNCRYIKLQTFAKLTEFILFILYRLIDRISTN